MYIVNTDTDICIIVIAEPSTSTKINQTHASKAPTDIHQPPSK